MGFSAAINSNIGVSTLSVIIYMTSHQNTETRRIFSDVTANEETRFMQRVKNALDKCLAKLPVRSDRPVCSLRLDNRTRTYRKFDNMCWYLLANHLSDTGFVVIEENTELCKSKIQSPLRTIVNYLRSMPYRRANAKKKATTKKAAKTIKKAAKGTTKTAAKGTMKKAAKGTTKKGTTKKAAKGTAKKAANGAMKRAVTVAPTKNAAGTTKKGSGTTKKPAATTPSQPKRNKTNHEHLCPLYCTDQYDPTCIEHYPRTKDAQLISFLNHCHMDLYICSMEKKVPSKQSTLHVTGCVSVESANFYIGSNTISTFNRIGWLGKESFRTILRRMLDI